MRVVVIVKIFGKEWWWEWGGFLRATEIVKLAGTILTVGIDFALYI